ncbi:MAG: hypothetical protein ACREO0_13395 [Pseudoxanthomonas sp.]
MIYKTRPELDALIAALEAEVPVLIAGAGPIARQGTWTSHAETILSEARPDDFDYVFDRLELMLRKYDIFSGPADA